MEARRALRAFLLCARHGVDAVGESPLPALVGEPRAKGNCVAVRRGGEEAGGEVRT